MTRDDIIRKFLDLHPDTPIDDKQYAVPLWVIRRMLETAEAAEREACAALCFQMWDKWMHRKDINDGICPDGEDCAAAIRARGRSEALTNLNKAAEDMGEEL